MRRQHTASRMHPKDALADYRDGLREQIAEDERMMERAHAVDRWVAAAFANPSSPGAERLLHAIDTDGANRYEPPECVHGVRFREWCFGCFCELASDYTQFKRDTRRAFGVLYRLHVVPEAVTTGDIRWLEEWSESE